MSPKKPIRQAEDRDRILEDAKPTDIVIPIMGATGAGKSTFINYLLDKKDFVKVGYELTSCTTNLTSVKLVPNNPPKNLKGQRVVVVDTPGFDDTEVGDAEILRRIATWLEVSYQKEMVLGGVIYLHDISQDRFSGTAKKNLQMFSHLCGDAALDKVVLVTSKWKRIPDQDGKRREKELEGIHWKFMIEKGSKVLSFQDSQSSALDVVDFILKRTSERKKLQIKEKALQIQTELVDDRKFIPQTEADKELRYSLQELFHLQKQIAALEADVAKGGDAETEAKLWETEEKMEKVIGQIQSLRPSLSQRVMSWFRKLWRLWEDPNYPSPRV